MVFGEIGKTVETAWKIAFKTGETTSTLSCKSESKKAVD